MMPTVVSGVAVLLVIFITGWTGDTTLPQSPDTPDVQTHTRGDESSWRSTLLSVIEPFYDDDCGCGMDMFEDVKNKATIQAKSREIFLNAHQKEEKDTGKLYGQQILHHQHRDNGNTFREKFAKKSKLMENFLDDFDLLFLLTSSFQIYLIFKMVTGKGERRRNIDEDALRLSNTLGFLLQEDHIADKYRTETEELAKTIEYLNRKCAEQEEKLKQNSEEIEELNSTVKRLQDSIKSASPIPYKGSKFCSYPPFTDLYRFQVPIDDSIFEDEPPLSSMGSIVKGKELFIGRNEDPWEY